MTVAQFEEEEEDPLEKKEIGGDTSKQNTSRLRTIPPSLRNGVTTLTRKYTSSSKGGRRWHSKDTKKNAQRRKKNKTGPVKPIKVVNGEK